MKQRMIVSFPRQGTDFFVDCLLDKNKNCYFREFFNPICTPHKYKKKIEIAFGSELNPEKIFFYNQELIENIYLETWCAEKYNITKEVFSFNKIPFYQKYFSLLALYRHRAYTFPTTKPQYMLPIFDSFIHSKNYLDFYLEIKLYLKTIRNLDNLKKQILIHIISWFIQFHHIQEYKVNVLKYGMLINLPKNRLEEYLTENLPKEFISKDLLKNILIKRDQDKINQKNSYYLSLSLESFCFSFIDFLKTLNTGLDDEYFNILKYV